MHHRRGGKGEDSVKKGESGIARRGGPASLAARQITTLRFPMPTFPDHIYLPTFHRCLSSPSPPPPASPPFTHHPHTCPGRETPAATNAATESVVPAQTTQLAGRPDLRDGGKAATRSMQLTSWQPGTSPLIPGEALHLLFPRHPPKSHAPLPGGQGIPPPSRPPLPAGRPPPPSPSSRGPPQSVPPTWQRQQPSADLRGCLGRALGRAAGERTPASRGGRGSR